MSAGSPARHLRIAVLAGTRPEAIKIAMLVRALRRRGLLASVVNTGQHGASARHMLELFDVDCDIELPPLASAPNLHHAVDGLRASLRATLRELRPGLVVVQGDTSSAYAGALAARDLGAPVAHVEAGLRTSNPRDPFPEEWFRRRIARHAAVHFAPCVSAVRHLQAEGIDREHIHHVGNTGIDALREVLRVQGIDPARRPRTDTIVVTLHRRENWDRNAEIFCDALIELAHAEPHARIVFALHPNPRIARRVRRRLDAEATIHLVEPMDYPAFVRLLSGAALVISDSGGIQEEAPHLGVPLMVPRANTERPECLSTGFVELTSLAPEVLVHGARQRLHAPRRAPIPFDDDAPFGDGRAGERIARIMEDLLQPTHALQ